MIDQKDQKRIQVSAMFDGIAGQYDRLNHLLSARSDIRWRRKAVKMLRDCGPKSILDIATGTGDLAIELSKLSPNRIDAADVSEGMLKIAKQKIADAGLNELIHIRVAAAEKLPYADSSFDAVTVAFGVRNFADLEAGLLEMKRVLKPNGQLLILEFGLPNGFLFGPLFRWYFRNILPFIGYVISRNKDAYKYLPDTVSRFPYGKPFEAILLQLGFKPTSTRKLSGGIAYIYLVSR